MRVVPTGKSFELWRDIPCRAWILTRAERHYRENPSIVCVPEMELPILNDEWEQFVALVNRVDAERQS